MRYEGWFGLSVSGAVELSEVSNRETLCSRQLKIHGIPRVMCQILNNRKKITAGSTAAHKAGAAASLAEASFRFRIYGFPWIYHSTTDPSERNADSYSAPHLLVCIEAIEALIFEELGIHTELSRYTANVHTDDAECAGTFDKCLQERRSRIIFEYFLSFIGASPWKCILELESRAPDGWVHRLRSEETTSEAKSYSIVQYFPFPVSRWSTQIGIHVEG